MRSCCTITFLRLRAQCVVGAQCNVDSCSMRGWCTTQYLPHSVALNLLFVACTIQDTLGSMCFCCMILPSQHSLLLRCLSVAQYNSTVIVAFCGVTAGTVKVRLVQCVGVACSIQHYIRCCVGCEFAARYDTTVVVAWFVCVVQYNLRARYFFP